jgi:hypothetical protein
MANPVNNRPTIIIFVLKANAINIQPIKHGQRDNLKVAIRPNLSNAKVIKRHPNGAAIEILLAICKHKNI